MVVNVEKLLKMVKIVIFQNLSKNGEILKNVGEKIKIIFAVIFFYTMDIKNTIFNPKFYQHLLPSLFIRMFYPISRQLLFNDRLLVKTNIR